MKKGQIFYSIKNMHFNYKFKFALFVFKFYKSNCIQLCSADLDSTEFNSDALSRCIVTMEMIRSTNP